MKVMLDNNLSPLIASAINVLVQPHGHSIVALRHKFDPKTPDEDWIRILGNEREWSVISGDVKITKNPAERAAWRQTDLIGFFFAPAWHKLKPMHQTARLLLWWESLVTQVKLVEGGALFQLPINAGSKLRQL